MIFGKAVVKDQLRPARRHLGELRVDLLLGDGIPGGGITLDLLVLVWDVRNPGSAPIGKSVESGMSRPQIEKGVVTRYSARPDTFKRGFILLTNWKIHEYVCNEFNIDKDHLVGK